MAKNPERDRMECYGDIERTMIKTLPRCVLGIEYKHFIKELMLKYPVSRGKIESFIKEFYIEEELIKIVDGMMLSTYKKSEAKK